jgi:dihydrofolate synthase / folylpolyglutamate synthase
VITVAGTNGKGSTCAMLEAIYGQAGYRTGVYTSPHLVHFRGALPHAGRTVAAADSCCPPLPRWSRPAGAGATRPSVSLTYFEFTTLAILLTLARAGLDVVILEVGLGGRLDAVNIIDADCAVITSIDLDHMEFLGPDREALATRRPASCAPAARWW